MSMYGIDYVYFQVSPGHHNIWGSPLRNEPISTAKEDGLKNLLKMLQTKPASQVLYITDTLLIYYTHTAHILQTHCS